MRFVPYCAAGRLYVLSLGSIVGWPRAIATVLLVAMAMWCSGGFADAAGGVTGTLRGQLVDAKTNAPIAGAKVVMLAGSGTLTGTTDQHGSFTFLDVPPDTYSVQLSAKGYESATVTGVTVFGDETQQLGIVKLRKGLKTIAHVTSQSSTSAFQPHQTIDQTTFQGARIDQALGEKGSTNFNQLVLSAPGVIQNANYAPGPGNSSNAFTIRGSASVDIGYQFDGVDYRGSFFDENPSQGYLNGVGGGAGSLQVVSGAGDATQGGIGAGVVNIVPGRGTYPGSGFVSIDVAGPWYYHSAAGQYGWATPNGKVSDFFSFRSTRSAPQYAPYNVDVADLGAFFGTSFSYDDDVLNNFYYHFGKHNEQQIQVLTDWLDHRAWTDVGGLANVNYYPYDPAGMANFSPDAYNGNADFPITPGDPTGMKWYDSVIPYYSGIPTQYAPVTQPEQYVYGPTNLLKIGYVRPLGPATSLNAFFYNWGGLVANNVTGQSSNNTDSFYLPGYNNAGGRKVGFQAQIETVASDKHTLTVVAKFENGFPYWNQLNYGNTFQGFFAADGLDQGLPGGQTPCQFQGGVEVNPNNAGSPCYQPVGPRIADWFLPQNPGQPVSASNPCIGPALDNGFWPSAATGEGCYIYSSLLAEGKWTGKLPPIPSAGFDYLGSDFQQFGVGLRDQWTPNERLTVDYGIRMDGQNLKWGANTALTKDLGNPMDIGTGYAVLPNSYLYPRVLQPRLAINEILTPNDSVRFSYGRSASFFFGQNAGTPTSIAASPLLWQLPAKDANNPTYNALNGEGPQCGSGWHPGGSGPNGNYVQDPNNYWSGTGGAVAGQQYGNYFQCANYAQSVYWLFDQAYAAPGVGGQTVATFNNFDLAWNHRFRRGWGMKLTGYFRRGYDTYQTVILNNGPPNPLTGAVTQGSYAQVETGLSKTYGIEYMLTTPDRSTGWSGFLTMNYVNALTSTPPVSNQDSIPATPQYLYETGALFHAAYLPPVSAVLGITYKTKNGWTINPIFSGNAGIPYGVGTTSYGFVNGQLYQLPTGNLGSNVPYAGGATPYVAECYNDPAFAGNYFKPKYVACRGDGESVLSGQSFTRPLLNMDMSMQYQHRRVTYGVYISNVFNNQYSEPGINDRWQPVAQGVGGAQSGQFSNAYPSTIGSNGTLVPNPLYQVGARNYPAFLQPWLPFPESPQPGRTVRAFIQFALGK